MHMRFAAAGLAATLCFALPGWAKTPPAPKAGPSMIVLVFRDGHRQSFNLSDIERVEFPTLAAVAETALAPASAPSRGRFLGKWEVGDGNGNSFFITLEENGDAYRSLHSVHGKWTYADGEAQITWDDGLRDAIRKAGAGFQKYAFGQGKTFSGVADNITGARNTTPHPI